MLKVIKRYKKPLIWLLVLSPLIAAAVFVASYSYYTSNLISADETPKGMITGVEIPGLADSGKPYTVPQYVRALYAFSMKVAVALSLLMIIYAGYKYLTSRGESGAINEAKDIIFSTLMGAALLLLVVLVANSAGVNVSFIKPTA